MVKPIRPKKLEDISLEWDEVCHDRHDAITKEQDISLVSVTAPCVIRHVAEAAPGRVLDAGCGTGYLSSLIAKQLMDRGVCYGIDASRKSISIAQKNYLSGNLHFLQTTIQEYCPSALFDMCVSNMALTCDPELETTLNKLYSLLVPGGSLLIVIAHPWFWAQYWGYQDEAWFHYGEEIFMEHDFSITLVKSMGKSTYIHRPLSQYMSALLAAGFVIDEVEEPYPVGATPEHYTYRYPRFLFIRGRKPAGDREG